GLIGAATTLATDEARFDRLRAAADAPAAPYPNLIMGGRHRDWLAADRALATVLADDPENEAVATRLAELRRDPLRPRRRALRRRLRSDR
ncbi:MAG: hypothetical protein ACRDJH_12275, partial [Thermomicrobiales bacterium]